MARAHEQERADAFRYSKMRRIYHFHVRKTAGTSLDAAFWALGGVDRKSLPHTRAKRVTGEGLVFVRGDSKLIEGGDYFYASSHKPAYLLDLPPETYTITILRDPAARIVSYYRYLLWARANPDGNEEEPFIDDVVAESRFMDGGLRYTAERLAPASLKLESGIRELGVRQFASRMRRLPFPGDGFEDFLERMPPRKLFAQLYMFSRSMDPNEAAERLGACDAVCFTETFRDDLRRVASDLDLPLEEFHARRLGEPVALTDSQRELLRQKLAPEYRLMELLEPLKTPAASTTSSVPIPDSSR